MTISALGRLKNHNVPHLHPNFTMFMPLNRLQLKICAFSGKFNVCSKWVLLSWIEIYCDFTLQTQIFTQKYRSWLRFYAEFLRKKLAAGGSVSMSHLDSTPLPKNHSAKSPSSKDQIVGTKSFHFKFVSSQSGTAEPHLDIWQQVYSHLFTLILPAE